MSTTFERLSEIIVKTFNVPLNGSRRTHHWPGWASTLWAR